MSKNSALCSQALGPILSSVEMSADDRNFHQVGKKLLLRVPLAKQFVDPTDSVLGLMSSSPDKGLKSSYVELIQKAFQPEWWRFARRLYAGNRWDSGRIGCESWGWHVKDRHSTGSGLVKWRSHSGD